MWKITPEKIAFTLGAIAFLHEVLIAATERPYIITASLALMGYPFVKRADELLRRNGR